MRTALLNELTEMFCFMEKHMVPDGEGGLEPTWKEGAEFSGIRRRDTATIAQMAEKEETASTYYIFVDAGLKLSFPDVIKNLESGETFQITEDNGNVVPKSSIIGMRIVPMKKWRLPL